ncbi:gamma-glutamyl hydrolase [Megalopta genalis]|uniref:gamma-glutamyl hydrolase n=1 Tax=Megalopta genalis TaxID=115081 RepID=UPI003FD01491
MLVAMLTTSTTIAILLTLTSVSAITNDRPIIGILSQKVSDVINGNYGNIYDSYIAASYIKFVEGAGARVVPIWIGKPKSYYDDILSKINGVLFPGGGSNFDDKYGYGDAAVHIHRIAKQMNDLGNYFPILGICLGFEVLTYAMANRDKQIFTRCEAENIALPLVFMNDYHESRMFGNVSNDIIDMLKNEMLTFNAHHNCVTIKQLRHYNIMDKFKILSVNYDKIGEEYISSFETIGYPFYGLQFHPEKNLYEWKEDLKIPHGENAARVTQFFANFFVDEARKNHNYFTNVNEEAQSLIYNYPVQYTAQYHSTFEQCYLFYKNGTTRYY